MAPTIATQAWQQQNMSFSGQIMPQTLGALPKSNQFAMPVHHLPMKPGLPSADSVQALIDEKRQ